MDQPEHSSDCNPIEHLWSELGIVINNMNHPHITAMNCARPC